MPWLVVVSWRRGGGLGWTRLAAGVPWQAQGRSLTLSPPRNAMPSPSPNPRSCAPSRASSSPSPTWPSRRSSGRTGRAAASLSCPPQLNHRLSSARAAGVAPPQARLAPRASPSLHPNPLSHHTHTHAQTSCLAHFPRLTNANRLPFVDAFRSPSLRCTRRALLGACLPARESVLCLCPVGTLTNQPAADPPVHTARLLPSNFVCLFYSPPRLASPPTGSWHPAPIGPAGCQPASGLYFSTRVNQTTAIAEGSAQGE